jgi:hypothetical protein
MPSAQGSLAPTGPNSFTGEFTYDLAIHVPVTVTYTPFVPTWSVPHATATFDLELLNEPITTPFSGIIGPTSIHFVADIHNVVVTGNLATPIDYQYDVSGTVTFDVPDPKPAECQYSTISVYIAFTNFYE